jgi:hypothetical protein
METGHDRSYGTFHRFRYFLVRESFHLPQDESHPLVGRDLGQGLIDLPFELLIEENSVRPVFRRFSGLEPFFTLKARKNWLSGLANMINRRIDRHAMKISRQTGFSLEILYGPKELDKDFLNNIKSFLSLPQQSVSHPVDFLVIQVKELLERFLIALLATENQFCLILCHCILPF